ncbi:hypothetical protein M440DRAFT_1464464 [Trichoderma longibrachiatum ATCC 18648]|uniref:WD40 repeat-like protein n=1 Tax=Trichoderma longibrachiatum ATCC 18648 TaxID=983965 RepID=A0A2T4BYP5_TRILO|nr:hypothetical protein M440DRAFT_1464464 [Trichoderma longibrachiatum ATCC 18648]
MSSFFTVPGAQKKRKRPSAPDAPKKRVAASKSSSTKASLAKNSARSAKAPAAKQAASTTKRRVERDDDDDEISGSDSDDDESITSASDATADSDKDSDNEGETAAEKRLRLAERYLDNVREDVDDFGFDAAEIDRDLIAERLQEDVAESKGKVYRQLASELAFGSASQTLFRSNTDSVTSIAACAPYVYTTTKDLFLHKWRIQDLPQHQYPQTTKRKPKKPPAPPKRRPELEIGSWDGHVRIWKLSEDKKRIDFVAALGGSPEDHPSEDGDDQPNGTSKAPHYRAVHGVINDIAVFERGDRGQDGVCIVAAVAKDHRLGRWTVNKGNGVRNGGVVFEIPRVPKSLTNGAHKHGEEGGEANGADED